jgi:hypothetical protein
MAPTLPVGQMRDYIDLLKELKEYQEVHSVVLTTEPADLADPENPVYGQYMAAQMGIVKFRDRVNDLQGNYRICPFEWSYVANEIRKIMDDLFIRRQQYADRMKEKEKDLEEKRGTKRKLE